MGIFPLDHADARRIEALVAPVLVAHGACMPAQVRQPVGTGQTVRAQHSYRQSTTPDITAGDPPRLDDTSPKGAC
jgi:hypothetical protein